MSTIVFFFSFFFFVYISPMFTTELVVLAVVCLVALVAARTATERNKKSTNEVQPLDEAKSSAKTVAPTHGTLFGLRLAFLAVYLTNMAADWLQGPHVYALYRSLGFGMDIIAVLFVAGFLSSAIFGTFFGSMVDVIGRKRMSLAFAAIYSLACFTKLSSSFAIQMFGRILSGVATSLLYSVFEAWMVKEHISRGFQESLLSETFSMATFGNGLVAILSGLAADLSVHATGSFVAPFLLSALLLILGGLLVQFFWNENYGESTTHGDYKTAGIQSVSIAIKDIWQDKRILALGMIQSLFEAAMYTFVFMWSPALEASASDALPYGQIFATSMISIMTGSSLFGLGMSLFGCEAQHLGPFTFICTAASLSVPIFTQNPKMLFWAFQVFEMGCGLYFPLIGTLRGRWIPEAGRATIMNLFRVPLNLLVVLTLLKVKEMSIPVVFSICVGMLLICTVTALWLSIVRPVEPVKQKTT